MLILRCLAILCVLIPLNSLAAKQEIVIGVLPVWGKEIAHEMWQPTLDSLNTSIPSHNFTLKTLNLTTMSEAVRKKSVDFILTNPGNYVVLEAQYGVSRLTTLKSVRNGQVSSQFGAVIFCRNDRNDINNLKDLKGKSFMGVKKSAFGGFQMAWLELKEKGINPFKDFSQLKFSGLPQDNIVYSVLNGYVDAGTVRTSTLERLAREGKIKLADFKILNQQFTQNFPFLHSTELYPEWPFAKLKHTADDIAEKVSIALLQLSPDSIAAKSAKSAGWTVPLDYYPVRHLFQQLQIPPYGMQRNLTFQELIATYWWQILLVLFVTSPPIVIYVSKLKRHLLARDNLLAKSEVEWSNALDFLDEPIYMVDLDDRVLRANRAFYQKIKSTPEKVMGQIVTNFTHPEGEKSPCKICLARKNQTDTTLILEADDPVNKDNRPLEISVKVIRDEQNNPVGIIQKMRDLTQTRKVEESIRKSELLFKGILQATPDPLVATNKEGVITLVNKQFENIFGYSQDEVLGKHVEILIPEHYRDKHVDLRQHYNANAKVRGMGELSTNLEGVTKSGEIIPLEISLSPFNIEDEILVIATLHNISNRLKNESELKRLASFPEQDPIPIVEFDANGKITYANPACQNKFPDLLDKVFSHPLFNDLDTVLKEVKLEGELVRNIYIGDQAYEQKVAYNPDTNLYRIYVWDITKLQHMSKKMAYQASHDALTNLINRREFELRLENLIQSSHEEGSQHVMCYMDLDQFKSVNDICGHIAGDELLKQLSSTLRTKMRDSDSLARLGGDEFGLILNNCPMKNAVILAEEIRKTVEAFRFHWDNKTFKVGISIGLVVINNESSTLTDILSAADTACYIAKEQGRNRVHVYEQDHDAVAKHTDEMNWIHQINNALDDDKFVLYCQKIVPVNAIYKTHYEVLIRLVNQAGETIPPNSFIPPAERFNLMAKIDQWVLENTLELIAQAGFPDCNLSINLSGQSLGDQEFMSLCLDKIKSSNIDPRRLCFEITETAMIANLHTAINAVNMLRSLGSTVSLDDFGSGLSSFAYLKNLPADYIKIDGIFVKEMQNDPINVTIVESIIQIGHKLGLKTIAEFVEDNATYEILKAMDIDFVQGYGIEKPVPIETLFGDHALGKVTPV